MKDEAQRLAAASANEDRSNLLLQADNLPIAKANLQSRIGALAQTHGVTVTSSGAVPDLKENGFLLIGYRADLSGSNDAVGRFLTVIETMMPPLLVREFTLRAEGVSLPGQEPTLSASIKLYVAMRNSDAKPSFDVDPIQADGDQLQ
jgi:Type II secretion system (T2SS), protein M subtype b